jgi:citrate lyase subunit beta/citryl-CoA lyase
VVVASAVAGLERPIGPVHTVLGDTDGLIRSSRQQYRQGFRGRTAIHPQQVPMINEEMSPTASELASARKLLASFDASAGDGITAFTGEGGQLVDPATVRRAREIVTAAARPGAASTPTTATDRME